MSSRTIIAVLAAALLIAITKGTVSGESAAIVGVGDVGMTVSDMDRSVAFYTQVLDFTQISDDEISGSAFERLEVFLALMRGSCACSWAPRRSPLPRI